MLSKSFKPAKCKTSLKLAVARIKLMRNKKEIQVKMTKRELAQLLEGGQDQTARIRVEHVIREEKTMAAYDLIELYCELLVARLPIIESQKSCPIDLKEAVASIVFASPRCADVPELMDIRKHFAAKYGKEFINSALEVRPDCGVSRLVVEKLSARAPDGETKVKTLTAIAREHNVKWDSKSFEEELQKPHDDLLNGPSSFASASKMPMESSNMKPSPATTQTNESRVKMSQNNTARTPTSFNAFSELNARMPHAQSNESSVAMPQNDTASRPTSFSNSSEARVPPTQVPFMYHTESGLSENASLNRPTWSMEFPDATTAAQVAAESAERASMAARAAAELASRGNMSRQNSAGSNESPRYNRKYERPENLRAFLDEHVVDETVPKVNDELESSQGIRTEAQSLQRDERMRRISSRETLKASNDYSSSMRPPSRSSSSLSSQCSVNDEMLNVNVHKDGMKDYSGAQRISSSESEAVVPNQLNMNSKNFDSSQQNVNGRPPSSHYVTDDEKFLNSNVRRHENYGGQTFGMDAGEVPFGSNHKKSTSGDSSAVVFDNYDSDAEDNNSVFGRNRVNLLDSYQGEKSSSFQSSKDPFNADQNRSRSFAKNGDSRLHLFTESHPEEHSETKKTASFRSQSIGSMPPAFDFSDGESTESEGEVAISTHKEAKRASNFENDHRKFTRSLFADESSPQSTPICMGQTKEVKETRNSGAYGENKGRDSYAADKLHKRPSSSKLPDNQSSPRSVEAPSNSNALVGGSGYSTTDEEESLPLRITRRQPTRDSDPKERSRMPSTDLTTKGSEVSNEVSDESGQGINFGRLTGGFKQRGFPRPPYVRSSVADASISDKPIPTDVDKQPVSSEVAKNERYNQESQPKPYVLNSTTSKAYINSEYDNAEGQDIHCSTDGTPDIDEGLLASNNAKITEVLSRYRQKSRMKTSKESSSRTTYFESDGSEAKVDSRRTRDVKLSRRTRDVPSESNGSSSRVTGLHQDTAYDAVTIQEQGSFKPVQPNPSSEHPSVASKQMPSTDEERPKTSQHTSTGNMVPTNNANKKPSTSSLESVSRENSLKKASHVHPKLPDYDSFAAHFHSLRSNMR